MKPSENPSYADSPDSLVQALRRYLLNRHDDAIWPKYVATLKQYGVVMRRAVAHDPKAQEALRFLESKVRRKAEQERTKPPKDLLQDILTILPLGYQTPPARLRRAEAGRLKRRAVGVRELAEAAVKDFRCRFNRDYYAPRSWKGAQIQVPDDWILGSHPQLEPLPELLELYASLLEKKADTLLQCAKQEPTEKQWRADVETRILAYVKRWAGKPYRARVAAILKALWPSAYKPTFGDVSETLRKREYRRQKGSRPSLTGD